MSKNSKRGRPSKQVDKARLQHIASNFWTVEEMADDVGCGKRTLEIKFCALIEKGRRRGRASLRSTQFLLAMGRPPIAAEYLRQKQDENGRQSGDLVLDPNGKPIKIRDAVPAIAPNTTMLIWLGKQHLGQSDKVDFPDVPADGFSFIKPPPKEPANE